MLESNNLPEVTINTNNAVQPHALSGETDNDKEDK